MLLARGARADLRDDRGPTAADIARQAGLAPLLAVLKGRCPRLRLAGTLAAYLAADVRSSASLPAAADAMLTTLPQAMSISDRPTGQPRSVARLLKS